MSIKKKLYDFVLGTFRSINSDVVSVFKAKMPAPHPSEPIDVVIPVVPKDLDILPTCIEGLRRNFANVLGGIYLVAPENDKIRAFAQAQGLNFVLESSVLGFDKSYIAYRDKNGNDRSGWIFQQLLKLSGAVGENRYFITIDSDHILLAPHTFLADDGNLVFYMSKEFYYPYYLTYKHFCNRFPYSRYSYVSHKMIFDKNILASFRDFIESKAGGVKWYDALIDFLKQHKNCSLSEFEMYGHYHSSKYRVLWRQKELSKVSGTFYEYDVLKSLYGDKYLSVTFPDYRKRK